MKTTIETIESFLKEYQIRFSKNTVYKYKLILNEFFNVCKKEYFEITRMDIRMWNASLDSKGQKPSSIRLKLCCLKSYFKYLIEEDLVTNNPTQKIELPQRDDSIPKYLEKKDLARFMQLANNDPPKRTVIEVLYTTGVRVSELLGIQIGDIKWDSRQIWIRKGKGNKERFVLFTPECSERLKDYLDQRHRNSPYIFAKKSGKPLSKAWVQKFFREYSKSLGFRVIPHMLRHTFAVHLAEKGMPQIYLQELLGHDDINTTKIYTKLNNEAQKRKYDSYQ